MPIQLDRLVIFGDRMSDIGNKCETGMGQVACALGLMRTTRRTLQRPQELDRLHMGVGEGAGGTTMFEMGAERTREHHRSLSKMSRYGTPPMAV
jgi:hypothetical protein